MKRLFRFAFALVAMAGMLTAVSCSKDDEKDDNGEEPQETNGITAPEISGPVANSVSGIPCTISWSSAQKDGASDSFTYQLALSDDGGSTWTTFDCQNKCEYTLTSENLESDKVYCVKVITTCSDGTTSESEVSKFVANYSKGTIGASVLTENSITMEWGNLLPYDYVELSISTASFDTINSTYSYGDEIANAKVENASSYKFVNLTSGGSYAIHYNIVSDGQSVTSGYYYAMAIDGTKYINTGEFVKIPLVELGGKTWTSKLTKYYHETDMTCYGKSYSDSFSENTTIAYGFKQATYKDIKEMLVYYGYVGDEIDSAFYNDSDIVTNNPSDKIAQLVSDGILYELNSYSFLDFENQKVGLLLFFSQGQTLVWQDQKLTFPEFYVYSCLLFIKE